MTQNPAQDVALIVGGGPGISSSCARLFAKEGMRVAVAARQPDKPVLQVLEKDHGVRRYACDAADPAAIELLFGNVVRDLGPPTLVVHTIDGRVPDIFRKGITEAITQNGRGGWYLRVIVPGKLTAGDEVLLAERPNPGLTVKLATDLFYRHRRDSNLLASLIACPQLSERFKDGLRSRLAELGE